MPAQSRVHGYGYESPIESSANPSPVAANHLFRRLNELNGNGHASVEDVLSSAMASGDARKVSVKDRIACFQWTWYTSTMATGGIANVLATIPFRSQWLYIIGLIFFFFNLCMFALNTILLVMRFRLRPGSLRQSFTDQFESLFVSAPIVSVGTIFINICQYGVPYTGPWLLHAMEILFWIWVAITILASSAVYLTLWSTQVFPIHTMTPVWVFPAYPLLITAPFAGNLINSATKVDGIPHINGLPIALAAVTVQGMGFSLSFMVLAAFVYRLMTQKLPRDTQRPGVFISVGPSGFTTAGIVQLGGLASSILPSDFMEPGMTAHAVFILKLVSAMIGLWLWGLAIWFFIVSVGSFWKYAEPDHKTKASFQMTFFSFVFPNTALITATFQIGKAFNCKAIEVVGCVMTGFLVLAWLIIFSLMLRSIWRKQLLWPKED